jgi:O-antigen/teichoic acid export membrane protein
VAVSRDWLHTTGLALGILLASAGIDYFTQVLLGGWLGEENYGDYGVAVSVAMLCAYFAGLGTDESLPRFLPSYRAKGRLEHVVGFLRAHVAAIVAVSIFIGVGGTTVVMLIGHENIGHPIAVIWWLVPPLALAEFAYVTLYNMERTLPAMVVQAIILPLAMLGMAALFYTTEGRLTDDRTVAAYGLGVVAVLPLYGLLLRKALPSGAWRAKPRYELRLWVRTAAPMLLSTLAYYAIGQADVYVMEHVGEEREVGILVACTKTADFVYLAYSATYLLLAPRIAPLIEHGRIEELRALVRTSARTVFGLSAATALIIVVFGRSILGLFGHKFSDGAAPLIVLAVSNVAVGTLSLAWPLLSLAGHERVPLPGLVVALVALAVSVELTVPGYGILAAAICKASVMLLLFSWFAWELSRRVGVRVWKIW